MKSRRLLPAKYHKVSPRQLNSLPFRSVRLSRALGLESFSRTPVISRARPFEGLVSRPFAMSFSIASCRRSSTVVALMYIGLASAERVRLGVVLLPSSTLGRKFLANG